MRRTATDPSGPNTGGPGRCSWCNDARGTKWTQMVLDGQSIRSVASQTPYGESAGRRHLRNHVHADLRVVSENTAADRLRLTDFASRMLALADEAAAVRQHAHRTHNPGLLLKASAQERDTLIALVSRLGIDSEESMDLLRTSDAVMSALIEVVRSQPELAPELAAAIAAIGTSDARDLAQGVREYGSRHLSPQLHAIPTPSKETPR